MIEHYFHSVHQWCKKGVVHKATLHLMHAHGYASIVAMSVSGGLKS